MLSSAGCWVDQSRIPYKVAGDTNKKLADNGMKRDSGEASTPEDLIKNGITQDETFVADQEKFHKHRLERNAWNQAKSWGFSSFRSTAIFLLF
jgi:hypothetical protein